jgi:type I restriction enzyme S subunit
MAQALFKSWFVDFDPVIDNALAAGNPIPEPLQTRAEARKALGDQRKPLPEGIQNQFPNRFVFNYDMGWVPEGWEVFAVEDAIQVNPKVALKKGEVAPFVDMKALPTSGFDINEVTYKAYGGGAKFQQGDVLLARITPCLENGKTGLVEFLEEAEVGFGSTEFIVMRGKGLLKAPYVACLARYPAFRSHCELGMVGSSGRQRVQKSSFGDYFLALPPDNGVLEEFDRMTSPSFDKMSISKDESKNLAKLRDTLLPKLFSGQLRIPEAEKQAAEAL